MSQSNRHYGGDPRDDQYGQVPKTGAAIPLPGPSDGGRSRGGSDPSTFDRKPPQYQDNFDDSYYGQPQQRPPAGPQSDGRARPDQQTGRRDASSDRRQQPTSRTPASTYNDRYDDGDDPYSDRQPDDGRRQRNDPANRHQTEDDYWNDPRAAAAAARRNTGGNVGASAGAGAGHPRDRHGGQANQDGYGNGNGVTDSGLLQDEMNEIAHHLELLKHENDAMRERLNDSKKRERELEEMVRKKGGDGKESADVEKLRAELEKKTKQLEKLASKQPGGKIDPDTEEMQAKIQELHKENERLKKGLPPGSRDQELEKLASTVKAKDKLIKEINDEKEELMAILEEDGQAEKFKKMAQKSKDLKKKNAELAAANEKLEAELLKTKPDSELAGKSGKKGCPNCEQAKKGIATASEVCKTKDLPKDMRPLQELVREQESHILDLQREVDTLRHAINDYQKEIERLEAVQQEMDELAGGVSPRTLLERKAALEEDSDLRRELEQARRKLRSSNRRVAQLEKWLDEIYNDKNFEIVVKGASFKGRKTTLALPEIQSGNGDATSRKGFGRKSFKLGESGLNVKSSRSSFNF